MDSNITSFLNWSKSQLADAGVSSPRLDSEIILAHTLNISRTDLWTQNQRILSESEIKMVKKYGTAAIFASGLVVDALSAFDNLWSACATAQGYGEDLTLDNSVNAIRRDWVRRFHNFSDNYCKSDVKMAETADEPHAVHLAGLLLEPADEEHLAVEI